MTTATTEGYGYRSMDGRITDVDDRSHQALVELPCDVLDRCGTSWAPGVFEDSLRSQEPPVLREHRWSEPIGQVLAHQSLPRCTQLHVGFDDFQANPVAKRAFNEIKSGKLKGWSWHFRHGVGTPVRGGLRFLRATMDELSAVSRPAQDGTVTAGLRSQPDDVTRLEEIFARHDTQRRSGHRSLERYEDPLAYLESVQARTSEYLDEERYRDWDAMSDGLLPKSPEFIAWHVFAKHPPKGPSRCL